MRFDVDAGGHARAVDVTPEDGGWRVTIDGRAWRTSMVRAGDRWSLLVHEPSAAPPQSGRSYDVAFEPGGAGAWRVHVNGATVPAALRTSAQRLRRQGAADAVDGRVVAPMPGRVVKVLVTPGTRVEARQPVVVVEAMKMENVLRAEIDGTVKKIHARPGDSLAVDAVILEFA